MKKLKIVGKAAGSTVCRNFIFLALAVTASACSIKSVTTNEEKPTAKAEHTSATVSDEDVLKWWISDEAEFPKPKGKR